jgi:hypothetical protein
MFFQNNEFEITVSGVGYYSTVFVTSSLGGSITVRVDYHD